MTTEVDKFVDRMMTKNVKHMHVDWGPEAVNMTAEERAKVLNDQFDWLAVPANNLAARLEGRAFLLEDSAHCARTKFDCKKMEYVALNRAEEVKARDQESFAALLREAAEFIKATVVAQT